MMMAKTEKRYIFRNRRTGKVLSISGMTVVQMELREDSEEQIWRTIPAAGTTVRILHEKSGRLLSALGEISNGKGLCIAEPVGTVEQIWKITATTKGFRKITHVHSGKVADIRDISDADGAVVQLWEFVRGENQEWIAEEIRDSKKLAAKKRTVKE